jgi:isochorismate pyruvate lyase
MAGQQPDEEINEPGPPDAGLEALFRRRLTLVQAAAATKSRPDEAQAPARVELVMANVRAAAATCGLDPAPIERAYRTIVALFIAHEAAALHARRTSSEAAAEGRPGSVAISGAALGQVRAQLDELDREIVRAAAARRVAPPDRAAALLTAAARAALA